MGLPLFVAPVESDLKARTDKSGSADRPSQSRSAIRRSRRTEDREARALRRRAAILRTHFPTPGPEPSSRSDARPWDSSALHPPAPPEPARYPWIESGRLPPPEAYQPDNVFNSWVTAQRPPPPSSRLNWERIASLFPDWDYAGARATSPPRPRPTEDRAERQSRTSSRENVGDTGEVRSRLFRRSNIDPQVAARFDRSPERSTPAELDYNSYTWRRRGAPGSRLGRPGAVDGLGDRNRSLSPEVWDTLLTTLTPDPQPPSVGSSFASATASGSASTSQSQNAAASSRTSFTEPGAVDELSGEQPCEHGEFSDSDAGLNDDNSSVRPDHLSMNVPSRHRRFVSALDSNDVSSTSYVRAEIGDRPTLHFHGRPSIRPNRLPPRWHREQRGVRRSLPPRPGGRSGVDSPAEAQTASYSTTREGSEEAHGSLEHSDADPEGAWDGMQRIVRGLVERRDIPDHWWAEAGLSRMMPGDS